MATDPNASLLVELKTALGVLNREIDGMHDLMSLPNLSVPLAQELGNIAAKLEDFRNVLQGAINNINALHTSLNELEARGYPKQLHDLLSADLYEELQGRLAEIRAASDVFSPEQQAAKLTATLGTPVPKV